MFKQTLRHYFTTKNNALEIHLPEWTSVIWIQTSPFHISIIWIRSWPRPTTRMVSPPSSRHLKTKSTIMKPYILTPWHYTLAGSWPPSDEESFIEFILKRTKEVHTVICLGNQRYGRHNPISNHMQHRHELLEIKWLAQWICGPFTINYFQHFADKAIGKLSSQLSKLKSIYLWHSTKRYGHTHSWILL